MRLPVEQFLSVWCHELHRVLRLVPHHDCAGRHLVAMTNGADLEGHKVAAAELAVDAKVEQGKLANTALHLRADAQCPDVLDLERRLLPNAMRTWR
jgi:hypothetical protein